MYILNFLAAAILQVAAASFFGGDLDRAGVNTHPYEFRKVHETPPPKGYKPVYVSHYGRHGSRTDWGAYRYQYVIDKLSEARAQGILSPAGDSLLAGAILVNKVNDGMNGRLTRLGESEHRQIARRLVNRYPSVFRKGSKVRAASSTVPRCIVSMAAFVSELSGMRHSLDISMDTGEKYYAYIASSCSDEVKAESKKLLDALVAESSDGDTLSIYSRLFTDPAKAHEMVGNTPRFQKYIWYTARVARASGLEYDMFHFLPDQVVYRWWDYSNRELYIRQGNSVEYGSDRMKRIEPLVKDMVAKAEDALSNGAPAVDLRFGHEYPLIAIAGFLHLDGVGERLTFDEIPLRWTDPMNCPFAINMQWVFYRNKAGDILVKIVYGDSEKSIAELTPVSGPYYRWNDLKTFCENRCSTLK